MGKKETLGGARLSADAKNRAWRSLLIGLSIDVGIALVLGLVAAFDSANGWGDLQWGLVTFAVGKSLVQALGSFVLRRVIDPSSIPSPLPPADPGPPADNSAEVPPNTAVEDSDADAEVEPKKKADFDPNEPARLLQADIDLAQTKAAAAASAKAPRKRHPVKRVPAAAQKVEPAPVKKAPVKKAPAKKAAPRKRVSE